MITCPNLLLSPVDIFCVYRICIIWQDKIWNTRILERAGCEQFNGAHSDVLPAQMTWPLFLYWLPNACLPRDILFGELTTGSRVIGWPFLCFKDVIKQDMKHLNIDPSDWQQLAEDREQWCVMLKTKPPWLVLFLPVFLFCLSQKDCHTNTGFALVVPFGSIVIFLGHKSLMVFLISQGFLNVQHISYCHFVFFVSFRGIFFIKKLELWWVYQCSSRCSGLV